MNLKYVHYNVKNFTFIFFELDVKSENIQKVTEKYFIKIMYPWFSNNLQLTSECNQIYIYIPKLIHSKMFG